MRKIIFFILLLILIVFIIGCVEKSLEESTEGILIEEHNEVYSQFCNQDSDCISEIDLQSQCSHYCEGDECTEDLRFCKAYYKDSEGNKNLINSQCKHNEPCKKPSKIQCVNNLCVVS